MAMLSTSTTELQHSMQTIFSRTLLPYAEEKTVLADFGQRSAFPKNAGSRTIRFFRFKPGTAADVGDLTEGVVPTTFTELDQDIVEGTLTQHSVQYKITDVLMAIEIFESIKQSIKNIGYAVGLFADNRIRNALVAAVTAAGNKRYAQSLANFNALVLATPSAGKITIEDVLGAMTQLDIQQAPLKNGQYFMVCPPQVCHDLMLDPKFVNLGVYQNSERIQKGEVGKWYGIKIVKADQPFREANTNDTEGTFATSGPIFTSIAMGDQAFGTPFMAGGSPFSPRIHILDKAEKSDPNNQFAIVATKIWWTVIVLNALWAVTIRSKSTFA